MRGFGTCVGFGGLYGLVAGAAFGALGEMLMVFRGMPWQWAFFIVVFSVVVDLLYAYLDPRIRPT